MNIQSSYGVSAYSTSSKAVLRQQDGDAVRITSSDPAKNADQVTISSTGKALAASKQDTAPFRTPAQEHLLHAASSDSASAEKIAYQLVEAPSQLCYTSIYDMGPDGKLNRLASSGRVIDQDFRDAFAREASIVDAQLQAIYASEKTKGTDPVQIINMLFDHINAQSSNYLEGSGWGWSNGVRVIG